MSQLKKNFASWGNFSSPLPPETTEFNMGASTTKGPRPLGKVPSGWGRHTTTLTSDHARLGSSLRREEGRQSNRRKGEPRAAQPEPTRTSRRRSVLLPKERDEIALSAAKPSQGPPPCRPPTDYIDGGDDPAPSWASEP